MEKGTTDKVIELLREFAGSVGEKAEVLWPHAVMHYQWDAIGSILATGLFLLVATVFKIIVHKTFYKTEWNDLRIGLTMCSAIPLGIALALFMGAIIHRFADAIEPTGGLLREIMGKM